VNKFIVLLPVVILALEVLVLRSKAQDFLREDLLATLNGAEIYTMEINVSMSIRRASLQKILT
jgi:hypothetical protein